MPGDFIMAPFSIIRELYDNDPSILNKPDDISKYFRSLLKDDFTKVPLLNEVPVELISPNSLVRFKGMVQDMFDPEFFCGQYETVSKITGQKIIQLGCYTDAIHCPPDNEINYKSDKNITLQRLTFCGIPVPGLNTWIKKKCSQSTKVHHSNNPVSKKRCAEDDDNKTETNERILNDSWKKSKKDCQNETASFCQIKTDEKITEQVDFSRNYPLLEEKGPTVLIKMYSDTACFKLNDTAEFICILSTDPEPSIYTTENSSDNYDTLLNWHDSSYLEDQAHYPPPSLVPRLHCLFFNKFSSFNQDVVMKTCLYESIFKEIIAIRGDIIALFTQVFGGDSLLAEYLLLHLISKVYGRCGTMCIGKFSLNITKCPSSNFTAKLYSVIQNLVEKSAYFPLTIDNLNNKRFVPKKDYEANRLVSGALQLSCNTQVVLDETQMQPGKLNSDGIRNLTAIGNVIQWQKLEYDFQFSQVEMEANFNMLVLSEGKSLLTCDINVPLKTNGSFSESAIEPSDQQLEKMRLYLTAVQSLEYQLTEEVQKALEDDFVEMRKQDAKSVNADSFYLLLTTARYMSLSYGQTKLSSSLWVKSKELDMGRRGR